MNNDRELLQQALDALESDCGATKFGASEALRARLTQPEPEPVAWISAEETWLVPKLVISDTPKDGYKPAYTAPPQREWQGLTENEIKHLWYEACQTNLELTSQLIVHLARNIEAKLKEKNT